VSRLFFARLTTFTKMLFLVRRPIYGEQAKIDKQVGRQLKFSGTVSAEFIAFLQALMRRRGRLPSQFATDVGVSHTSVSRWLSGKEKPSFSSCVKLANYTGVPLQRVLYIVGYLTPAEETPASELPDFREYVNRKYPQELDDDLVTLIEDLIERRRGRNGGLSA
jgi:transcriptional regulator with XRE-family HTH domain